jgi:thiol-disulfide isomerase/thioredoxin
VGPADRMTAPGPGEVEPGGALSGRDREPGRRVRPRPGRVVGFAITAVVAAALVYLAIGARLGGTTSSGVAVAEPGRPVAAHGRLPDLRLARVGGRGSVLLGAVADRRWLVLDLWAPWCSVCREEFPRLDRLVRAEANRPITWLGVDSDGQGLSPSAFLARHPLAFPSVVDPSGELAARLGFDGLPDLVVVAPGGRLAFEVRGEIDRPAVEAALARLIPTKGR